MPDIRDITADLLTAGLPGGVYVYPTPVDQLKAPAVVIGTMSWAPARMASLVDVDWDLDIPILVQRGKPEYSIFSLEALSRTVADLLLASNYRVVGFTSEGMSAVGGVDYLSGTLNVTYKERNT